MTQSMQAIPLSPNLIFAIFAASLSLAACGQADGLTKFADEAVLGQRTQALTGPLLSACGSDEQGAGDHKCSDWYPKEPTTSLKFQACKKMAEGRYASFFPDQPWTLSGTLIGYRDNTEVELAPNPGVYTTASLTAASYTGSVLSVAMDIEAIWNYEGAECINKDNPRWRSIFELFAPLLASVPNCKDPPWRDVKPLSSPDRLISYTMPDKDRPMVLVLRSAIKRLEYELSYSAVRSPDVIAGILGVLFTRPAYFCSAAPISPTADCPLGLDASQFKRLSLWRRFLGRTPTGADDYDYVVTDDTGVDGRVISNASDYVKVLDMGYVHQSSTPTGYLWGPLYELKLYENTRTGRHLISPVAPPCIEYSAVKANVGWILAHPRDPKYIGLKNALSSLACGAP